MTRALRRDDGITTAELVVAMAVMMVLGALTLSLILGLSKASDLSIQRSETASTARAALESWRGLLAVRESPVQNEFERPSIESIAADTIVFYSSIDNREEIGDATAPTKVSVHSDNGVVIEERFIPNDDGEYPVDATIVRRLVDRGNVSFSAVSIDGKSMSLPMNSEEQSSKRALIGRIDIDLDVIDGNGATHSYEGTHVG